MSMGLFEEKGFIVIGPLLGAAECLELDSAMPQLQAGSAGARHLLDFSWCTKLAKLIKAHPEIGPLLPSDPVAIQCIFFEKSKDQNWLVPLHQDLSIPVKERVPHAELIGWSEKEGSLFVQPPDSVLQELVAVRLHMDDCGPDDGPLRMVPGSHKKGRLSGAQALAERDRLGEMVCPVARGGALLMKPLLLHASSKASGQSKRRILHFVFGPRSLPCGLQWQYAV
ncbi:phytanoyl-CoA dioxygenase family protein [Paraherbaspirillum soli]|uniref:Phytanoyl-CoA dioxygenase family protein n=1 Tax=Paraherbaspirillum soli TaxID=631222 RepID=A0ABW0M3U4_9BURK